MRISQVSSPKSWLAQSLKNTHQNKILEMKKSEITTTSRQKEKPKKNKRNFIKLLKNFFSIKSNKKIEEIEYLMTII